MLCPDGVRLATRIWQPDPGGPAGEGPWPVLLMRQPYGRAIASTPTYADPSWYAAQGFLVAIQDVRGRGDSEGSFGGFAQEAADGAAAVRWARSLPGGDGRVATYGFSYQGATQLLNAGTSGGDNGAVGAPDPLPDCLVPAMAGLDERCHWASEGDAHWWALGLAWALQLAAEGCRRRGDASGWLAIRHQLEQGTFLREGPALLKRLDPQGMGWQWLQRDPARPEGWRIHPVAPALLRRPMLLVGGWHDPHLRGVLDLHRRARQAGGHPSLVIGAWTHLNWRGGIDELQLAFLRRHLPARPHSPREDPVVPPSGGAVPDPGEGGIALQFSDGRWALHRQAPEPAEPAARGWSLASGGLAAIRSDEGRLVAPSEGGGELRIVHDPWRPAPGRGGHLGLDAGEVERSDLDGRADVACFTTPPLERALELVGVPRLELVVAADQDGFDLCAALSHLPREGTAVRQVATGVARFRGEGARAPQRRRLTLQPLALRLAEGDRLRLSLAAAAWPQIAVNAGDGSLPLEAPGPRHRVIGLQLQLAGSRLWLTALTGAD
ncbi:CocE/NonD family hydrolase [Cyanobium sp. FGCU-52]|nr:CocE/NonD family hydrolase [Cyanobium sp. FGCU52]